MGRKLSDPVVTFLFLFVTALSWAEKNPSLELMEEFPLEGVPEPSGITYIPGEDTFFVVGDEGHLAEMSPDGELIRTVRLGNLDLEGISWDSERSCLIALAEKRNLLVYVDPGDLSILQLEEAPQPEAGTFEGIAVLPGGTVVLVNQTLGKKSAGTVLFYSSQWRRSPAGEEGGAVYQTFSSDIEDQSDILYDAEENNLYIISDKKNRIYCYTLQGELLWSARLKGKHQEGVARDSQGNFYIAQDSGGVLKFRLVVPLR